MNEPRLHLFLTTLPDQEAGAAVARALVQEGLAACVNIVPGIRSFYTWKGSLEESSEVLLVIKTSRAPEELAERLRTIHPYELPELVALSADFVESRFAEWVTASSGGPGTGA